ncbi:HECT ubiquitin-transferase [Helicosporidium sp. ATCC 50920]|nr:HECT ubiquitin-transferase [Helicosporidium sp. ATCC 50920]|eukprot:KDD76735.1 HECT ubiquitin-transferase [Helicosporidium sp. ATCC 50920]
MCIVRVRRNHLVRDALDEIARQKAKDLFKPLRVHFIGEDGIDAGGVKKEFFQLLVAEVLSPDYGMLCYQPESRTYWFCPVTLEAESSFLLLGLVLGLAIYNGVLLDFPLPLALYRKILGQEVGLRDLEDMQPALGKSLRALLTWEGEGRVEDVFCQSFVVDVPSFGSVTSASLKPDGEALPVTDENRREFVDLYVDFWLNRSIHVQFEAFAKGFLMLCGGPALQLFSATELERLVCGNPFLDFDALQRAARYEGGFHPEHRVVQWLWQVVGQFNAEEKRLFLKFFTGSDRAPIGGLANLRCIVQRDGADSNKLPTSHTCFNTLLLPSYRSREKLADRLKLAILNSEGFGLE